MNQGLTRDYNLPKNGSPRGAGSYRISNSFSYPVEVDRRLAKKLMEFKGEIRGVDLRNDAEFIIKENEKEEVKKVKKEFKKIGYPIEYGKLETMKFYPGGLKALSLLLIKKALNFDAQKIKEIGSYAPKISFIVKIFIKYFSPISKFFFKETPRAWKKY